MGLPKLKTILFASGLCFVAGSLIYFPGEAFQASVRGLDVWWKIVFPSLLPFFILSELLISYGVVRFIGVLLEPVMRPLFRVPGVGGFVWAMGWASGNPAGARLAVRMREDGEISRTEGERLVAFTSCSNPLFIFGAVSVGFFQNPALGPVLGLSHYGGNILVGLLMRYYGKDEKKERTRWVFPIRKAFREMHKTRILDVRPFGKILGDAVISSVQTLLMIGGFIILFSVFNRLLSRVGIANLLIAWMRQILSLFSLPENLAGPVVSGLFEITIGSQLVSETAMVPLLYQAVTVSFFLAFGGFSIQAQVASILARTDIRFRPFFMARLLHGFLSAILTALLWNPLFGNREGKVAAVPALFHWFERQGYGFQLFAAETGPILTIAALVLYTGLLVRRHAVGK